MKLHIPCLFPRICGQNGTYSCGASNTGDTNPQNLFSLMTVSFFAWSPLRKNYRCSYFRWFCKNIYVKFVDLPFPCPRPGNSRKWDELTSDVISGITIFYFWEEYMRACDSERFPFTKKFRKFRLGWKWNTSFSFVPLEIFRNKRNSWKGSPVYPVETSQWKICVPFTNLWSL